MRERTIYLAGGCFWGMEELLRSRHGVIATMVGYVGGVNKNPTYENHSGHAEAVAIKFDEDQTSFKDLLDFFFRIHDPTTKDRQGNDMGESYRSAIFYQNDDEKTEAEDIIEMINESGFCPSPIVTSLEKFEHFWPAEEYHQNYLQKNPGGYTCHFLRSEMPILGN